jgi:hypothetical protein
MAAVRRALTERFDRTYIINLPQRADRLHHILAEFARAGISLEAGRVEVFPAIKPDAAQGFPSIGARGCFLSHRGVLLGAMQDKLQRVLIVEDDLAFSDYLMNGGDEMLDGLDAMEWGLAYLGHNMKMPQTTPPQFLATGDFTVGSHFYAVQGEAIPLLVTYLDAVLAREPGDPSGGPMHYDGALTMFRQAHPSVCTVAASEPLGYQCSSPSDITPRSWDKLPILRELSQLLRRVRTIVTQ